MDKITILSSRNISPGPGWQPIYDFEDLFADLIGAAVIAPGKRSPAISRFNRGPIRKFFGDFRKTPIQGLSKQDRNILFISAVNPYFMEMANCIPGWRKKFDTVVAYVIDSYPLYLYPKVAGSFDHIFVPILENVESVRKITGTQTSLLPMGTDVLLHGSDQPNRGIDIIGYGRQPPHYQKAFFHSFNRFDSNILYLCSGLYLNFEATARENREYLLKTLQHAKVALSFDTAYYYFRPATGKIDGVSIVTPRYFECLAAGCAVVGKRPITPLADELFDWDDSLIELPDDPQEGAEFMKQFLADENRLERIREQNYYHSLKKHDWRYRIEELLRFLQLQSTLELKRDLDLLRNKSCECRMINPMGS